MLDALDNALTQACNFAVEYLWETILLACVCAYLVGRML